MAHSPGCVPLPLSSLPFTCHPTLWSPFSPVHSFPYILHHAQTIPTPLSATHSPHSPTHVIPIPGHSIATPSHSFLLTVLLLLSTPTRVTHPHQSTPLHISHRAKNHSLSTPFPYIFTHAQPLPLVSLSPLLSPTSTPHPSHSRTPTSHMSSLSTVVATLLPHITPTPPLTVIAHSTPAFSILVPSLSHVSSHSPVVASYSLTFSLLSSLLLFSPL